MGCRCALRRSGRAHRRSGGSRSAQRSCASPSRAAGAARPARAGLGATRRPGSPRACCGFGAGRVCAPSPPPPRVAPRQAIPRGKAVRAPLRGGGSPVRRPAGRRALGHGRAGIRDDLVPARRWPSRTGLMDGRDPVAERKMGMYIAILPDADRGMPRWGVSPVHGLEARIGIGAPSTVAQPQACKRLGQPMSCPATPDVCRTPPDRQRACRKPTPITAPCSISASSRNGGWTHRGRRDFRRDPTALRPPPSGGDGLPPRSSFRADRAVHQSREESNDGTHET